MNALLRSSIPPLLPLASLALALACARPAPPPPARPQAPPPAPPAPALAYPQAHKADVVDEYHGVKVPDPYRWLESSSSKEARAWIEAENRLTFGFLEKIAARPRIKERLRELWNYERYSPPFREGGRYFYTKNDGLQNQAVLYVTQSLDGEPRVLLDPNELSPDGTVALTGMKVTDDGKLLAYGLATAGSDWQEWRVREIATGKDLPDSVKWIKFSSVAWTRDGKGFYYGRFAEPAPDRTLEEQNYYHKLYYHRLGTPQDRDLLVYERKDQKEWQFSPEVTEDGRYLLITVHKGTDHKYRILYKDLHNKAAKLVELIDHFDHEYGFIANDGPVFYFQTDRDAPRRRVIAIDTRRPDPKNWQEVLPQAEETLESVSLVNDRFIAQYLKDAHAQVRIFDRKGKLVHEVSLPGIGSASGFGGKRGDTETFYGYTSYNTPAIIYRLDLRTFASTVFRKPKLAFDPAQYETKQVFYKSKDGTRVPMFLTAKKGAAQTGEQPTYLYGYGGFNIPLTPAFSPSDLVFMEMGGLHAVANLRGGGEYGEQWHRAGTKHRKQTVFDDFIAAAEWLVANQYTKPAKLAIGGGSNGGLLVGACMTQRPDLFGAALPAVGVMDMLRFHKFTIGWAWADDYGTSDDPEDFKALYAYSPLHNVRPAAYPATLVTTADHDDRVVPGHSFKFTAALQAAQKGPAPVLIRIETRAGHGAGKPTSKKIEEAADRLSFLYEILKMKAP